MDHSGTPIRHRLERVEENLSSFAARSRDALRRQGDQAEATGYRPSYALDVDRIINSQAYTRYIDKTQVFSLIQNDHLTHRVLHVQLVSRIARTVGRALGLNEDLIEAISLGHDIGHPPFGHEGERILSALSKEAGLGPFHHNLQSVRFLDVLEREGRGWNLTLQTLDGIFCHNGESHDVPLSPNRTKNFPLFDEELTRRGNGEHFTPVPLTLEGCVVKFADTISYIGRDIEDAIRLGIISRDDLPPAFTRLLGETNGTIVYTLVTDVITHSTGEEIRYSEEVARALVGLKAFNLKHIYMSREIKKHLGNLSELFAIVFDRCLDDLRKGREDSLIIHGFAGKMAPAYLDTTPPEMVVRDFISGMTDNYFLRLCPKELRPSIIHLKP
ncbi:deoxyguanosinetriphosphate triphosphohydrolase-like protein [Desulfoluna limicola]|uniref:Deoxyguanosinetriphosphate triphosphohydrolase-like protein n=1 Tax=Desulfoluna limicola TaxID=2810562 RepID=A0ABN6F1M9_9BACT|nr:HD domain-containing protein [Desulfoluna limicola]BCS96428.1 deoxyguanosinetriphosphate triphosphohydrolase-like protein [Desulfoluna limicola]